MIWKILLCALFGYLVGCINPSYLIARLKGFDIRRRGSGNAGASNALITMGKAVGIASAIFDILKAAICFWAAPLLFGNAFACAEIASVACILGHIFPFYMKFKGGKGLACLGGVYLALDWRLFLILLTIEIVLLLWIDYICIVPITASILLPVFYGVFGKMGLNWLWRGHADHGWVGVLILSVATIAILYRHIQNLHRIRIGAEMHFSFLWSRDKESERQRVAANMKRYLAQHGQEEKQEESNEEA